MSDFSSDSVSRPADYATQVDQLVRMYPDLVQGFQKDAIQNAVGARPSQKSWDGWKCEISYKKTDKGMFLIVEDFGTTGLTGKNYSMEEISSYLAQRKSIPAQERLARFSSNSVSGGNTVGAGLYGVGKMLYSSASEKYCYYFDSLTEHEGYRANYNDNNRSNRKAFEGDEAIQFIFGQTGLGPISHIGTRIIIANPRKKIIDSMNNGEMMKYASATWWRILPFCSEEGGIFINGTKVTKPAIYKTEGENDISVKDSYYSARYQRVDNNEARCINRFGFFIHKDELPAELVGFYFYRRGMKIGEIHMANDFPPTLNGHYYGFIEVNNSWEEELSQIEDNTHFDVLPAKKNTEVYRTLQSFVRNTITELLKTWGYIKDNAVIQKKLNDKLQQIKENVVDFLSNQNVEPIGHGDRKPPITVRLENVSYPSDSLEVFDNQEISFGFKITNNRHLSQKCHYLIQIVKGIDEEEPETVDLAKGDVSLDGDGVYSLPQPFVFKVTPETAMKFLANRLNLIVTCDGRNNNFTKHLVFYYSTDPVKRQGEDIVFRSTEIQFPKVSSRRINTGESAKITYLIENNLPEKIKAQLKLYVIDENDKKKSASLLDVANDVVEINANDTFTTKPYSFTLGEDVFQKLPKGKVSLRARLTCLGDSSMYEKGEILGEDKIFAYFNTNEKRGLDDSFNVSLAQAENEKWAAKTETINGQDNIKINISHPSYLHLKDDSAKDDYVAQLMFREVVMLYVRRKQEKQIGLNLDNLDTECDKIEAINLRMEELWFGYFEGK